MANNFDFRPKVFGINRDAFGNNNVFYEQIPILNEGNMDRQETDIYDPFSGLRRVKSVYRIPTYDNLSVKNNIDDFLMRDLGLGREIVNNNKIIQGLTNPREYLNSKNADLVRIGQSLGEDYIREFGELINRGYSRSEADALAKQRVREVYERKLRYHKLDYPENATKSALLKGEYRSRAN